jgi:dTDP-4-dehydrorhamnose 3,5-epimerase
MELEALEIEGVWIAHSPLRTDERGYFGEWFKEETIRKSLGRGFKVAQANHSSSKKGAIRGIHFSNAKGGQGKWIKCISGSIWDVVVDIRPKSPTFKKWIGIDLNSTNADSIFISEGLGHAFISLEENSCVTYLLTSQYSPREEFSINPLDPVLNIKWPIKEFTLSSKDSLAPTLLEQIESGNIR